MSALPDIQKGGTRWVTRHRPKIDRVASPWLIRRFIDPSAEFLFVPPDNVTEVAAKFDAIPFDTPTSFWGHEGPKCTFDKIIGEFSLTHPPLQRVAEIVRAADTNCHGLAPQATGLLALSVGLSRMFKDDNQQMEHGLFLYDALYRWARDGYEEIHDSASGAAR